MDAASVPSLDLVVLRSTNLPASRAFYEALGITFVDEQHGHGPEHLAATLGNGVVLELYPSGAQPSERGSPTDQQLGFVVQDMDEALHALQAAGGTIATRPTVDDGGRHATVTDPDGLRIHISARA